jgi:hypothetical protein
MTPDQRAVAQADQGRRVEAFEQAAGLLLGKDGGLAATHHVLGPANRMRRIDGEDLADHEPVEQHANGGQVQFVGEELGLLCQGGSERALDRHEHQHAVVRLQLLVLLVPLAGESVDMALDVPHKLITAARPFRLLTGRDQPLVAGERDLRIDNHRPAFGKHDDDVRLLGPAGIAPEAQSPPLRDVFPALGQPRRFENAFERQLAPAAKQLRISS